MCCTQRFYLGCFWGIKEVADPFVFVLLLVKQVGKDYSWARQSCDMG